MKQENITCEVIQDLLPLYKDGCCSEQSKKLVEEHLTGCKECREMDRLYQDTLPDTLPDAKVEEEADVQGIKQGIHKINRWKRRGIVSLSVALTLLFILIPAWNYFRGSGLTYANLKASYVASAYVKALIAGDYEKAYKYLDIESRYEKLLSTDLDGLRVSNGEEDFKIKEAGLQTIQENGFAWYDEVCRTKFMENIEALKEADEMAASYSNFQIGRRSADRWSVSYSIQTTSGQGFIIDLDVSSKGVEEIFIERLHSSYDKKTGDIITPEALEEKALMFDRLYRSPSINETVMELLYEGTEWDWRELFEYQ